MTPFEKYERIITAVLAVLIGCGIYWFYKDTYTYKNPQFLWLLIVVPIFSLFYVLNTKDKSPTINFSGLAQIKRTSVSFLPKLFHLNFMLRTSALVFITFALARPQSFDANESRNVEGIDIVIAQDVSGSMLSKDFKPNRLVIAKEMAEKFIESRKNDRVGLVIYEGQAMTLSPLTTDKVKVISMLRGAEYGRLEGGTAIGLGLGYAVNRLRESKAKSKVVILLSDGENNVREYPPLTVAETATRFGIKVYTIGVGSKGMAPTPVGKRPDGSFVFQNMPVNIDEKTLTEIAEMTEGKYFRATDEKRLAEIYQEIDRLEKTKIEVNRFLDPKEEFWSFAFFGLLLLGCEFTLKNTVLRTTP